MKNIKFVVALGSEQSFEFGVGVLEKIGQNSKKNYEKARSGKRHFFKKREKKKNVKHNIDHNRKISSTINK